MLETYLACLKIFLSFFLIVLCLTFFAAKNSNIFPGKQTILCSPEDIKNLCISSPQTILSPQVHRSSPRPSSALRYIDPALYHPRPSGTQIQPQTILCPKVHRSSPQTILSPQVHRSSPRPSSVLRYSEPLNKEYIERIHQMSYSSLSDNGMLQIFSFLIK